MIRIRSLHQRLLLFLVLPALAILLADGIVGFNYARNVLLDQWQTETVLRLERAARLMDARLGEPIRLIEMYNRTGLLAEGPIARRYITRQLETLEGISSVRLTTSSPDPGHGMGHAPRGAGAGGGVSADGKLRFRRSGAITIAQPSRSTDAEAATVTLTSTLLGDDDRELGRLEVVMRFETLTAEVTALGWWQTQAAGIVNDAGQYLTHTRMIGDARHRLGDGGGDVEILVRERLGEASGAILGPGHPPATVAGFYRMQTAPWTVVMFASGDSVLAPIIRFRNYFFAEWAVFALLLLAVIRLNVNRIVAPIKTLSAAASAVAQGQYGDAIEASSSDEIGQLVNSYNRMVDGLKERDLVRNTFGRYMDPKVARDLLGEPERLKLGGTKREVVIMMADIRGFTGIAAKLPPDGVIRFLNHYFSHMIDVIHAHRGIIVDFVGDGLLVFFEPVDELLPDTACRAVHCAKAMQGSLPALNDLLSGQNLPPLAIGIGLNAGEVVVGNIGSAARAKYGIVGAAVNMTQRIQSEAGSGEIVVSDTVYRHAACHLSLERAFSARPKGIDQDVALYVLTGEAAAAARPEGALP